MLSTLNPTWCKSSFCSTVSKCLITFCLQEAWMFCKALISPSFYSLSWSKQIQLLKCFSTGHWSHFLKLLLFFLLPSLHSLMHIFQKNMDPKLKYSMLCTSPRCCRRQNSSSIMSHRNLSDARAASFLLLNPYLRHHFSLLRSSLPLPLSLQECSQIQHICGFLSDCFALL